MLFAIVLALALPVQAATPALSIRGIVVSAATGAPLADARVSIAEIDREVLTGADGTFGFDAVPAGRYTLTVSIIGYAFVRRPIDAAPSSSPPIVVPLAEGTGAYTETVTVRAEGAPARSPGVAGAQEAGPATLQDLRGVAADDPMRAVQALPGVVTGDDFQAEFSVRGSAFRQLGVVIDGADGRLLLHAVRGAEDTGSVAMVNTDVLSHATLLTGAHPRRTGDWIGSTLAFDVREGSRDRITTRVAVSGTSASTVVEGPLTRSKRGSWLVSARKSYIDWLIRKLEPDIDSTIGFTDAHAKFVFDATPRQRIELSVIGGDAVYRETQASQANGLIRATSGSTVALASWRYAHDRFLLTGRLTFAGGDFNNTGMLKQELARGYTQGLTWQGDLAMPLGSGWTAEAGALYRRERMNQILREYTSTGPNRIRERDRRDVSASHEIASGYAQITRELTDTTITVGARATSDDFAASNTLSPWVMFERRHDRLTWRASGGTASQFQDPALVDPLQQPRPAERARYLDGGVEQRLGDTWRWSAGAFYRREIDGRRRVGEARLDPATGAIVDASTFPIYSTRLDGTSRGVDVVLTRRALTGPTGWLGYTWAHTRYHDVVTGERYDGDFDQRHTLNVFVQQRLSYRLSVSAKLRVGSNVPIVGYYTEIDEDTLHLSSDRNQLRLPAYARLDLRASRTFAFERRRLTLFVEVMNATGRRNIRQSEASIRSNGDVVSFAERLVPFVPSAGILIEF